MLKKSLFASIICATVAVGLPAGQSSAAGPVTGVAPLSTAAGAPTGGRLSKLVAEAKLQTTLHIWYLSGGGHGARPAALRSHVDCSGFVRELYSYAFGVDIGGGSGDSMVRLSGQFVKVSHPVPGDVALFGHHGSAPAYHSAIYVGNMDGHPTMVGSPTTGQNIRYQRGVDQYWAGDMMGYWHYRGATAADSSAPTSTTPAQRRVPKSPVQGALNRAVGGRRMVQVVGWAVDPRRAAVTTYVRVRLDGRNLPDVRTTVSRPDVNHALQVTGRRGFDVRLRAGRGRHTVCVTALQITSASTRTNLGCRTLAVRP